MRDVPQYALSMRQKMSSTCWQMRARCWGNAKIVNLILQLMPFDTRRLSAAMSCIATALENITEFSKTNWSEKRTLSYVYSAYSDKCINRLIQLKRLWDWHFDSIMAVQQRIKLGKTDNRAIYSASCHAWPKETEVERQKINRMLAIDAIQPAQKYWASSISFAPKKDGTFHYCVDHCKLGTVKILDTYQKTSKDKDMDFFGYGTIFSTLDTDSRYWKIKISEEDKDETAITSQLGHGNFTRMPYGLKNAAKTSHR